MDSGQTYEEALAGADNFNLAGYNDWRLPTIKELYSLIESTEHSAESRDTFYQVRMESGQYYTSLFKNPVLITEFLLDSLASYCWVR